MTPKHTDPKLMRYDEKSDVFVQARAPYNFVPLPEKMVEAKAPPPQDIYDPDLLTGWIECNLETCSPTYIRGMMTEVQFKNFGQTSSSELTDEQKNARAPFFSSSDKDEEGFLTSVIPGSSLRGMVRAIVEIIGYGRMRWVGNKPTVTFRAVAVSKKVPDPLRQPYEDILGIYGSHVQAGYLKEENGKWQVLPAQLPSSLNFPEKGAYLKVKERVVRDLPGYIPFNDIEHYEPAVIPISFEAEERKDKRGQRFTAITHVSVGEEHSLQGVLVCSGNMLETGKGDQKSPRKSHALVLAIDESKSPIPINEQGVQDYLDSLTTFQREHLWGKEKGCLLNGMPVFYVTNGKEVICFGHSPFFRIPARLAEQNRAATPLDFVPDEIRRNQKPDLADAIFGWVEEKEWGPAGQCAGRVFFSDAHFERAEQGLWYSPEPITPKTLAGPKATTFQHYLIQDKSLRHDPDYKATLAHYGTSQKETTIRGHKFYWFKGANPDIEAGEKDLKHPTQLTLIVPLKPKVHFTFRIRFENLRPEELGALWWALTLPGKEGAIYRHHLGMGKPLGMGAVAINELTIHLTPRVGEDSRYDKLFAGNDWHLPLTSLDDGSTYVNEFERFVLKDNRIAEDKTHLAEVERIQALLEMLQWRGDKPDDGWLDKTRYMEIEHDEEGKQYNEYKERPVLPSPFGIWAKLAPSHPEEEPQQKGKQRSEQPGPVAGPKIVSKNSHVVKTGIIKWYNLGDYGYHGYIQPDDGGEDVHVDEKHLKDKSAHPKPGQRVRFGVWFNKKNKPTAEDVEILSEK